VSMMHLPTVVGSESSVWSTTLLVKTSHCLRIHRSLVTASHGNFNVYVINSVNPNKASSAGEGLPANWSSG